MNCSDTDSKKTRDRRFEKIHSGLASTVRVGYELEMNGPSVTRREALTRTGFLAGAALALAPTVNPLMAGAATLVEASKRPAPFRFCLNTASVRGHKLGIVKEIELAAKAGYDGIEPWVDSIQDFIKGGGTARELKMRAADAGLAVESAIGFPEWIVDDDDRRAQGMERAKREMELMAQVGAKRFAAPPAGATDLPKLDLFKVAERYRALIEAGDQLGILPMLELWGFSKNLSRLGECVLSAVETGHPKACVLADIFHLHKGGSDFHGLGLLGPDTVPVLHLNDFPSEPGREKIDDSFRVYAGDGVAPLPEILRALRRSGGQKVLSFEVFNRLYWTQDPVSVVQTGLAKMKAVAAQAV